MKVPNVTIEMIQSASNHITKKAYLDTIRPTIEGIQNDLLNKFRYKWDPEKQRITSDGFEEKYGTYLNKWSMSYLISDKDFGHLMTEYNHAFTKAGFEVKEFGHCPLLCAESDVRDAVIKLCDTMKPVTGISYDDFFCSNKWEENLQKYVDLTIEFLSPYVEVANKATKVMTDKGMEFVTIWKTNDSLGFNFEKAEAGQKNMDGSVTRLAVGTIYNTKVQG